MDNVESQHVKRTQKDYSYSFKLQVVAEVESGQIKMSEAKRKYGIQGDATIRRWIEKFGNFDKNYQIVNRMKKTPEQELMELRQQIKLLKKQNQRLEKELEQTDHKAIFFDMMIDIAEKEFKIPIRKKYSSDASISSKENKKKG